MPCIDLLTDFFMAPGAKLGSKIGTSNSILLMFIFHLSFFLIFIFGNRFYLLILSICLFGIGSGLPYLTYIRNCWKYYPKNEGLINGVIISSSGILSTFLTILADFIIINPNRKKAINGIYPKEIADNVKNYIKIISIILAAFDLIGYILTFDYDKIRENKEEDLKELSQNDRKSLEPIDVNSSNETTDQNLEKIIIADITLKDAFFSLTNFKLLAFCFCGFCKKLILF